MNGLIRIIGFIFLDLKQWVERNQKKKPNKDKIDHSKFNKRPR